MAIALGLEAQKLPNTRIILISDKPHLEYHAALYRVVTGSNPLEVCIPLSEIFRERNVEIVEDDINAVNLKTKTLTGKTGSHYRYDYLTLALGSETDYFSIPGLKDLSYGMKSINEAIKLNRHIHELFDVCHRVSQNEKECALHFVVVGAGASGVELSAELASYTKKLAELHRDKSVKITIDLIEAEARILPTMPVNFSQKIERRLRLLGVNILVSRPIIKEEIDRVYLKDIKLKTKTVIWTAGVTINHLYRQIVGLKMATDGRIEVDDFLRAKGSDNVFVIGDGASSKFSGMAQTAIGQGRAAAKNIYRLVGRQKLISYRPKLPHCVIPVGQNWAAAKINGQIIYGKFAWLLRRLADLRYFLMILPLSKAITVWQSGKVLTNICPICSKKEYNMEKESK